MVSAQFPELSGRTRQLADQDQLFFHMAAEIDDGMLAQIAEDLDAERGVAAARALVSIAVARNLSISQEDRQTLRRVHGIHDCDPKQVDLLDARAADPTPTAKFASIGAEFRPRTGTSRDVIDHRTRTSGRTASPNSAPAQDELTAADACTTKFMPVTPQEPPPTKFALLQPPGSNSPDTTNAEPVQAPRLTD
ncbi:hypothetical protein ACWEV3_39720 [Saccharopolyspora sp. NPDC003752]